MPAKSRVPSAQHVIDYTRQDFAAGPERYDVVVDSAGNPALSRLRRALTPRGTSVIIGRTAFDERALQGKRKRPERLTALIDSGALIPKIDERFRLANARAMHRLESGLMRGSVVPTVRETD